MLWKDDKKKAITISYDDGYVHDKKLIELFEQYEIPCTFNLNSKHLSDTVYSIDFLNYDPEYRNKKISKNEIKGLYRKHEIACHTSRHKDITKLGKMDIVNEVLWDRFRLSLYSYRNIKGLAYPYGRNNDESEKILRRCGIKYGRVTECDESFAIPNDFYCWKPTVYHLDDKLMSLSRRFIDCMDEGVLFHVWGHSCELYENNRWNIMQDWLKYIGEYKDQIWFATNIEIFEYVMQHKGSN